MMANSVRRKSKAKPVWIVDFPQLTIFQRLKYLVTGDHRIVCKMRTLLNTQADVRKLMTHPPFRKR